MPLTDADGLTVLPGSDGSADLPLLVDASGRPLCKVTDGANLLTVPGDGDSSAAANGIGVLGSTAADVFRMLLVEDSGKLLVASSPPVPPPGTTEFVLAVPEADLVLTGAASPDDTDSAVVGNGLNLKLQLAEFGTEGDPAESGSKVEIYWVEGAGATEHLVDRYYTNGDTGAIPLPEINKARDGTAMTGNGTNTFLRVRRERLSAGGKEVDFAVRGYIE